MRFGGWADGIGRCETGGALAVRSFTHGGRGNAQGELGSDRLEIGRRTWHDRGHDDCRRSAVCSVGVIDVRARGNAG